MPSVLLIVVLSHHVCCPVINLACMIVSSATDSVVSLPGLLNLTYDAMPSEYVTLVVTEFGAIPPTSVPVILREYRQEPTI